MGVFLLKPHTFLWHSTCSYVSKKHGLCNSKWRQTQFDTICCYCISKRTTKKHCKITITYINIGLENNCVWVERIFERNITTFENTSLENTPTHPFAKPLKFIAHGVFLRDYSSCMTEVDRSWSCFLSYETTRQHKERDHYQKLAIW